MKWTSFVVMLTILAACQNPGKNAGENLKAASPNFKPYIVSMGDVGNGGHGKIKNGKVYLMDLIEVGVEDQEDEPVTQETKARPDFIVVRERVKAALINEELPIDEVTQQIRAMARHDALLANTILEAMSLFKWQVIDEQFKLLPLDGNIIESKEGDIVLIANRRGRTVHISRPYLQMMNVTHQGALILHETISPLLPPKKVQLADGSATFRQDSERAREITGLFYTQRYRQLPMSDSLTPFLIPGEIPFLPALAASEQAKETITSSFFALQGSRKRVGLSAGTEAFVGPVHLEYKLAGKSYEFFEDEADFEREAKAETLCTDWFAQLERDDYAPGSLDINLVFQPKDPDQGVYELKFARYSDGKDIKQYLKHERIHERRVIRFDWFGGHTEITNAAVHNSLGQKAYPASQAVYKKKFEENRVDFQLDCRKRMKESILYSFKEALPTQGLRVHLARQDYDKFKGWQQEKRIEGLIANAKKQVQQAGDAGLRKQRQETLDYLNEKLKNVSNKPEAKPQ